VYMPSSQLQSLNQSTLTGGVLGPQNGTGSPRGCGATG
jgi:hypothetical protein